MSDRERLLLLLESFGITPAPLDVLAPDQQTVRLQAQVGGVTGYSGFSCDFGFNADGSFKDVAVWE